MSKSIKRTVWIRVAAAVFSVVLFSFVTTYNIFRMQYIQADSMQANALLNRAQSAETAHYKWSSNLSNALYAGTEFTGSTDPTTCVLGQWLYSNEDIEDSEILRLRSQLEPLHRQLHESSVDVLATLRTNPTQARSYYQNTIQSNLSTLVGMLDQVVSRAQTMSAEKIGRASCRERV